MTARKQAKHSTLTPNIKHLYHYKPYHTYHTVAYQPYNYKSILCFISVPIAFALSLQNPLSTLPSPTKEKAISKKREKRGISNMVSLPPPTYELFSLPFPPPRTKKSEIKGKNQRSAEKCTIGQMWDVDEMPVLASFFPSFFLCYFVSNDECRTFVYLRSRG